MLGRNGVEKVIEGDLDASIAPVKELVTIADGFLAR